MVFVIAILVGLAYGGGDQYLGSLQPMLALGSWTPTAAQMSAPWLLLPFAFGATQVSPRRAMLAGLLVTEAAMAGYVAMTVSPFEGVSLATAPASAAAMLLAGGNVVYGVAGIITGPVYGLLGQRWRVSRSWLSAAMVAGALCLEPWARVVDGRLDPPSTVWIVEVAAGAVVTAYFAARVVQSRRAARNVA
jgi:hypothetical protein